MRGNISIRSVNSPCTHFVWKKATLSLPILQESSHTVSNRNITQRSQSKQTMTSVVVPRSSGANEVSVPVALSCFFLKVLPSPREGQVLLCASASSTQQRVRFLKHVPPFFLRSSSHRQWPIRLCKMGTTRANSTLVSPSAIHLSYRAAMRGEPR